MKLTNRELATVLAALRFWQEELDDIAMHNEDNWIKDAVHFQEHSPLSPEEIDEICERLNTDPKPKVIAFVEGGIVQGARSNWPPDAIDFSVCDHDDEAAGEDEYRGTPESEYESLEFGIY